MTSTITVSPLTRIEGHLAVRVDTEQSDGAEGGVRVRQAYCEGEMFRGMERILEGRDPLDAQQITQRICGVCPISHGIASCRAQEMAYGIAPNRNGRLLQNLIFAANYMQSHILHFYHLAALDFVDVTALLGYKGPSRTLQDLRRWIEQSIARKDIFPAAPFLPRMEGDYLKDGDENVELVAHYVQALEMRRTCHEMAAVFGARLPHSTAIVPGGCTQRPTMERVLEYQWRLKKVQAFIRDVYVADVLRVAKHFPQYFEIGCGPGNFLCYGVFELDESGNRWIQPGAVVEGRWEALDVGAIAEDVACSRFAQNSGLHPASGRTEPAPRKEGAYSWLKAPRYRGAVMEVGPLARVLVNYHDPSGTWIRAEVDKFLAATKIPAEKLNSVLGRHAARALEALWLSRQAFEWLGELELDGEPARDFSIPRRATGYGLTEAPRGALGHWLEIDEYLIKRYQCVVPTTWNCSPRDDQGQPGAVEQALEGLVLNDAAWPIEVGRVVRSFDPCIACAVH